MLLITTTLLEQNNACSEQVTLFLKTFGDSTPLTPEVWTRADEVGLDIIWCVQLLPPLLRDEYDALNVSRRLEYYANRTLLFAEYESYRIPLEAEYTAKRMALRNEYREKCAPRQRATFSTRDKALIVEHEVKIAAQWSEYVRNGNLLAVESNLKNAAILYTLLTRPLTHYEATP